MTMQITALNIYPIKGCRGVAIQTAQVDRLGLTGDRRLMLVDRNHRFISQREIAPLATIVPELVGDSLRVSAPSIDPFAITIDPDGPDHEVWVWRDNAIVAADQGDAAAAWFSAAAGTACRLVAFGSAAKNPIDPAYTTRSDAETTFTDGYPLTVAVQESLDNLNRRLANPVTMERFRPSVVVRGAPAWSEDAWSALRLGDIECDSVKPCARCVVTTTDQVTGARNGAQEPLRTLASFRTLPGRGAIFSQNVIPRSTGVLRVGDRAELL